MAFDLTSAIVGAGVGLLGGSLFGGGGSSKTRSTITVQGPPPPAAPSEADFIDPETKAILSEITKIQAGQELSRIKGQAPSIPPDVEKDINTQFDLGLTRFREEAFRTAQEIASASGMRLSDTGIQRMLSEQMRKGTEGLEAGRAGARLDFGNRRLIQDRTFSESILGHRANVANLMQGILMNRYAAQSAYAPRTQTSTLPFTQQLQGYGQLASGAGQLLGGIYGTKGLGG